MPKRIYLLTFALIFTLISLSEARKPIYGVGHIGAIYYRTTTDKEYVRLIIGGDIGIDFLRAGVRLLPLDWVDIYAKIGSDSFWIYGGSSVSLGEISDKRRRFVGIEFAFVQFSVIVEYAEHSPAEDNFGFGITFSF